jgi:hypothetical protein
LLVDGLPSSATFPQNQIKKIAVFTLTVNDPAGSGTPVAMRVGSGTCGVVYGGGMAPIGVLTYGASVTVEDWHSEYIPAEVEIGGYAALNAAFPGFQPGGTTAAITAGVKMSGLSGFGAGGASYQFDIGPNAQAITLEEFSRFGTQTNLVWDHVTRNTCNNASDLAESHYFLGHGSPPKVLSSCLGVPETLSAGMKVSNLLIGATAPTISSGFGLGASIVNNNGPAAFTVNVGTGGGASNGVLGLPTAANGWACFATDRNSNIVTRETATTTATATLTAPTPWGGGDILQVQCFAY